MNYIKYLLIFLIVLWIVGFWFAFKSSGITSSFSPGSQSHYLYENGKHDEINFNWIKRIKFAEKELTNLEDKIIQNEMIIQNLK